MKDISDDEMELIESLQDDMARLKRLTDKMIGKAKGLMKMQEDPKASAAAHRFLSGMMDIRSCIEGVHAEASTSICDNFTNPEVVVFGGGGGR